MAERRTDIFGVGVEETAIGKKIGEEESRKDDKVRNIELYVLCENGFKIKFYFVGYMGWAYF